jgi:glycerol uptake facilitator-like aquaporin
MPPLHKRVAAEAVGSAFLLAAVVGSGIMADQLSGGNAGLALLANAVATGASLTALIVTFGAVSGAHFNPVVTLTTAAGGGLSWREGGGYVLAQLLGALAGVAIAHVMFGQPVWQLSAHVRSGGGQLVSEFVATFGLVAVITRTARDRPEWIPVAVGAYITGAYWFTASTSFANPAVTVARAFTDTFAGIRHVDGPAFIAAQLAGGVAGHTLARWLEDPRS